MNQSNSYTNVGAGEEIVISGIAGRFPKSNNLKEFQENLMNKMDLGSSDHRRWHFCYDMPNRIGIVDNLDKFDSQFFDIPAVEANIMDPSERTLLELTFEAIVDAGMNPKELQGTRTSVLTAICTRESINSLIYSNSAEMPVIGYNNSIVANRISAWLNLTGPSFSIDTACSTSGIAITRAYELIQSGECDAAIVATSNTCLNPLTQLQFYRLGILSPTGHCKPFDEEGTGYMRADTFGVMYMQKAKDARRIYATCLHGKINCDGFKEEGITYPSYKMQKTLLEELYEECGFPPHKLNYIEAHATATLVGDPVEVMSMDHALCSKRNTPLLTGSIKSNLGHPEPSSGICQFAKQKIAGINSVQKVLLHQFVWHPYIEFFLETSLMQMVPNGFLTNLQFLERASSSTSILPERNRWNHRFAVAFDTVGSINSTNFFGRLLRLFTSVVVILKNVSEEFSLSLPPFWNAVAHNWLHQTQD